MLSAIRYLGHAALKFLDARRERREHYQRIVLEARSR